MSHDAQINLPASPLQMKLRTQVSLTRPAPMITKRHLKPVGRQRISWWLIVHKGLEVKPPLRSHLALIPRTGTNPNTANNFEIRGPITYENSNQTTPLSRVPRWKRGLDLAFIGITLPLSLPLLALVACWIRLISRGPALLRQERVGRGGRLFVLYKFRSMRPHSDRDRHESYVQQLINEDKPMIKLDLLCDSELIPGGRWLRASGLDELPQLLNVARGEMSLVGPRPCLPGEHVFFSPHQRERFTVLPGITGIWQAYGKNLASFIEMNIMDLHYVRHASPQLDLQIMVRTPAALVRQLLLAFQHKFTSRLSTALRAIDPLTESGDPPQRHRKFQ